MRPPSRRTPNLRAEKAACDICHRFVVSFVYDIPGAKSSPCCNVRPLLEPGFVYQAQTDRSRFRYLATRLTPAPYW
jgi:hypothetical protein